jgi:hypothetical protein
MRRRLSHASASSHEIPTVAWPSSPPHQFSVESSHHW